MQSIISEVQIVPVKPENGLVGFASFILFGSIYCSSVGIITKPNGGYRLAYPTKKVADKQIQLFYPINKQIGGKIEDEVINIYEKVTNHDRYSHN